LVILAAAPGIAKYEGVGLDSNRKPDLDDVRQAAESLVIVRFLIAENE